MYLVNRLPLMWVRVGSAAQTGLCCGAGPELSTRLGPGDHVCVLLSGQMLSGRWPPGWYSQLLLSLPDRIPRLGWGAGVVVFRIQIPRPRPI